MDTFDVVVIGSGPGGYVAAIRAAQLGLKAAVVEKHRELGGTCLNVGCIPSKALLESSELYHTLAHGVEDHGIRIGKPELDVAAFIARKERVVREITGGLDLLMKKNKIAVLQGLGSFAAPDRIQIVSGDAVNEIGASHVVIATGSMPVELPFLPFDHEIVVNSTDASACLRAFSYSPMRK